MKRTMISAKPTASIFLLLSLAATANCQERSRIQEPVEIVLREGFSMSVGAIWEDFADSTYKLYETYPELQGFQPAQAELTHGRETFQALLPEGPVGRIDSWQIPAEAFIPFLRQFHRGVRVTLHHGVGAAPGAYGTLGDVSSEVVEVICRVHAEFLLVAGEDGERSSWLTPAQFTGRMVFDRRERTLRSFHLFLPPRNSNVDVNVPYRPAEGKALGRGIADIGYIPRMELRGGEVQSVEHMTRRQRDLFEHGKSRLAEKFYPFAELGWLSLNQALAKSRETDKPMHVIILFGSLDDESC